MINNQSSFGDYSTGRMYYNVPMTVTLAGNTLGTLSFAGQSGAYVSLQHGSRWPGRWLTEPP